MAKIYVVPNGFQYPEFNWKDTAKYKKDIEDHSERLKQWLIKRCVLLAKNTENVGEIIRFPVADGYAQYMVGCMKPLELIHLEYYDGYSFEYANRLTAKDVEDKINQQNALNRLFASKKQG